MSCDVFLHVPASMFQSTFSVSLVNKGTTESIYSKHRQRAFKNMIKKIRLSPSNDKRNHQFLSIFPEAKGRGGLSSFVSCRPLLVWVHCQVCSQCRTRLDSKSTVIKQKVDVSLIKALLFYEVWELLLQLYETSNQGKKWHTLCQPYCGLKALRNNIC